MSESWLSVLNSKSVLRIGAGITILFSALFLASWLLQIGCAIAEPFPSEYRDAATLQATSYFVKGSNPYSMIGVPPFCYLYGFLFPLVSSFLAGGDGENLLTLQKILVACFTILSAVLIALEVKRYAASGVLALLGFSLMLATGWNISVVAVRPDSLGLVLVLGAVIVLSRRVSVASVLVSSFLTLAAFYTKQYFLFVSAAVFLFLLFRSPRLAVFYAVSTAILGGVSFLVIRTAYPSYFSLVLVAGLGALQDSTADGYLRRQTLEFAKQYFPLLLLVVLIPVVWALQVSRTGQSVRSALMSARSKLGEPAAVYGWLFLVACVCLKFLGSNNGAWMSYYYQLALPPLVVLGLSFARRIAYRSIRAVAMIALVAFCLLHLGYADFSGPRLRFLPPIRSTDFESWQKASRTLDRFKSRKMFLSPVFEYYAEKNRLVIPDNGHTQGLENLTRTGSIGAIAFLRSILPDMSAQVANYTRWKAAVSADVRDGAYSIIAVTRGDHALVPQGELERSYRKVEELDLPTGREVWPTEFWIPLGGAPSAQSDTSGRPTALEPEEGRIAFCERVALVDSRVLAPLDRALLSVFSADTYIASARRDFLRETYRWMRRLIRSAVPERQRNT